MELEILNQTIISCRKCPRLVEYRELVAKKKKKAYQNWDYWGKPVPAFGDILGRVLVIGLAPGPHGSNRTGRMFTGDASGVFLFAALHRAGFANQAMSVSREDGLMLRDMLISAACRCVPPDNKPTRVEMDNCRPYLNQEIKLMQNLQGIVALGRIGFDNARRIYREWGHIIPNYKFKHGESYQLGEGLPWLVASYHPSQQNTQTGRLTVEMFDAVWHKAKTLLRSE
ncbi:MAG: uracil-DNA glycosylase [Anaerolineales bacterium]|nr:uracil-DNA glycosylase [Anaerolineae bacterium]PWB55381.1 MAG: uracil-DNA glycosylase [Anaerolineales bacterium]